MMLLPLATALSITAAAQQAGIHLTTTPFQGGQGKNALLVLESPVAGGGVISIDGNPLIQDNAPAANDPNWSSIAMLNASSPLLQEITLPSWIRVNVTTAGTGTVSISLQGVQ